MINVFGKTVAVTTFPSFFFQLLLTVDIPTQNHIQISNHRTAMKYIFLCLSGFKISKQVKIINVAAQRAKGL
jgi:hypothetical protein